MNLPFVNNISVTASNCCTLDSCSPVPLTPPTSQRGAGRSSLANYRRRASLFLFFIFFQLAMLFCPELSLTLQTMANVGLLIGVLILLTDTKDRLARFVG